MASPTFVAAPPRNFRLAGDDIRRTTAHCCSMHEMLLTRSNADRRLYVLDGIGTLRLEGLFGGRATAVAGNRQWDFRKSGALRRGSEAVDGTGSVAGRFAPRGLFARGGSAVWQG